VVVGGYDPQTHVAWTFSDVLVSSFADGTPIERLRVGYSAASSSYYFNRAGRNATGGCRSEFFRLVPISGNRLAIADPANPNIAWNLKLIPQKMYATFDCTSTSCMSCGSSPSTDLDAPHCVCDTQDGACTTTKPGLGGPYGPGQVVFQAPKGSPAGRQPRVSPLARRRRRLARWSKSRAPP
jgi:hypothetical protein